MCVKRRFITPYFDLKNIAAVNKKDGIINKATVVDMANSQPSRGKEKPLLSKKVLID
jgi:hypothetical protein